MPWLPPAGTGDPPPPQRLHHSQTLGPHWDNVASLLFSISTFAGFSLSFPWLWGSQMHCQGAAGMWCKQRCPVSWLCVFQPCWTLRMAARKSWEGQAGPGGPGLHPRDRPCLQTGWLGHPEGPWCCVLISASLPRNLSAFTPTVSRKTGSRVSRMFSMSHKSPPPKVPQPNRLDEVYEALKKGLT